MHTPNARKVHQVQWYTSNASGVHIRHHDLCVKAQRSTRTIALSRNFMIIMDHIVRVT